MQFRPVYDIVMLEEIREEKIGGIYLPDHVRAQSKTWRVIAMGEGRPDRNGVIQLPAYTVGDTVVCNGHSVQDIFVDGKHYAFAAFDSVIGVLS